MTIRLLAPSTPPVVAVSRWDLVHLLYSAGNPPVSERDLRELQEVVGRVVGVLTQRNPSQRNPGCV